MLDFDSSSAEYIIDKRQPVNISFKNTGEYTSQCVNLPITLDGACIGIITNVADDFVHGVIWNSFIIEKMYDNRTSCSVELDVNKNKKQGCDFQ